MFYGICTHELARELGFEDSQGFMTWFGLEVVRDLGILTGDNDYCAWS